MPFSIPTLTFTNFGCGVSSKKPSKCTQVTNGWSSLMLGMNGLRELISNQIENTDTAILSQPATLFTVVIAGKRLLICCGIFLLKIAVNCRNILMNWIRELMLKIGRSQLWTNCLKKKPPKFSISPGVNRILSYCGS